MKQSRGTVIPPSIRRIVLARDGWKCVVRLVGVTHECLPGLELDHVRSSGALGRKSRTTVDNLVTTCPEGHRIKTENGRAVRPLLVAWIEQHADLAAALSAGEGVTA
jgi:5-methylcytosine-specific restriction endonuclease McrA